MESINWRTIKAACVCDFYVGVEFGFWQCKIVIARLVEV